MTIKYYINIYRIQGLQRLHVKKDTYTIFARDIKTILTLTLTRDVRKRSGRDRITLCTEFFINYQSVISVVVFAINILLIENLGNMLMHYSDHISTDGLKTKGKTSYNSSMGSI